VSKCMDCGKKTKGLGKRCYSCSNSGINSPRYIDGRTNKICYCIDCKKQLRRNSYVRKTKRCRKCWKIFRKKNRKIYLCKICSNPVSDYRHSICYNCANPGLPHCEICNKQLHRYDAKKCKSCVAKAKTGIKSNGWQGGISKLPYAFEFTPELKQQIRKRDSYQCQNCSITEEEHLIIHLELTYNLCPNCNRKMPNRNWRRRKGCKWCIQEKQNDS